MFVLLVLHGSPGSVGGMEEHGEAFADWMARVGIEHAVLHATDGHDGQVVFRGERSSIYDMNKLNEAFNPRVVFFNSGHLIEEFAALKLTFPNSTFVYRTGGNEFVQANLRAGPKNHEMRQAIWADLINKHIDVLITNSSFTEGRLRHIGVQPSLFLRAVGGTQPPQERTRPPQYGAELVLFCAARMVPYKNHATLVQVLRMVLDKGIDARLRLAGDGPLHADIVRLVQSLRLNNHVDFLGPIRPAEVAKEMANADAYVQLSVDLQRNVDGGTYLHAEGMGRSLLLAIGSGTRIFAGNSGALPEIIHPGNGSLVNPTDPKDVVKAIEAWHRKGQQRGSPTQQYSWSHYFALYDRFLGGLP